MDRRTFNATLASAAATSMLGCATDRGNAGGGRTVLYNSVGGKMTHFDVDVEGATLTAHASVTLPSVVQYAWPHPSYRYLYASTSDRQKTHSLCALRVEADGALALHGEPKVLATRPINNSIDASGSYSFTCYSEPANLTVHRINGDGTLGSEVVQAAQLDMGIFPHQIRTTPANRSVVLVTRGVSATANSPEEPGALKIYKFNDGQMSPLANIVVGGKGGLGYGPRHLDFHPTQPWVYLSIERQNQLHMHHTLNDSIAAEPSYIKRTTLHDYGSDIPQLSAAIHVHPRGHVVYVSNRARGTVEFNGQQVSNGGENTIAVFSIQPTTGEPTLLQTADAHGFYLRTFSIDPSGRLLVAASGVDMLVREGNNVRRVPGALHVFRIAADGRLTFVRRYDLELGPEVEQQWVGMMALPG
jgi:6-phosphogluconolactonase (cycloisomerase 2 family)